MEEQGMIYRCPTCEAGMEFAIDDQKLHCQYCGASYVVYGGTDDAERAMVCFLPDYMDEETFLLSEKADNTVLKCVHIQPLNNKFADDLNHRDYLGSIMNLGIERDQIGDILAGDKEAYIFATPDIAQMMEKELIRIRHTSVRCEIVRCSECGIEPKFQEISGSVDLLSCLPQGF